MTQATGTYDEQGYRVFRQLLPLEAVNAIRERVFEDLYPSEAAFLRHPSVKRETNTRCGVVPVANRLAISADWRVVGFAPHHAMYCDIALRRVG